MIVLDASAAIELVLGGATGRKLAARLGDEGLHAPHLIDVEVVQTLRQLVAAKVVDRSRAEQALDDYRDLFVERHPHDMLLPRVWQLRSNLTAYDATYVALAEALGCVLVTLDRRMARARVHRAKVEIVG